MPLMPGSGKSVISSNIEELMRSFKRKGKIGTSTPKSGKAAVKQAAAIAYSKARENK